MKKIACIAAVLLAATAAPARASQELAQKNACLACHAVDKKKWLVLPTLRLRGGMAARKTQKRCSRAASRLAVPASGGRSRCRRSRH